MPTQQELDALADHAACETMLRQIGRMNLLAISGGRVHRIGATTISLPVRYGYHVEVGYDRGSDLYWVTRVFLRGTKRWEKAHWTQVFCEDLGDTAYKASCYLD